MTFAPVPQLPLRAADCALAPTPQLLAVLDGLPGLVGLWDRDLCNLFANRAYREYFGVSPGEIRGMHIKDVVGDRLYEENLPFMQRAMKGEEQVFERTLTDHAGNVRHTHVSYVPGWEDGEVIGVFVLVTDISERVWAQRQQMRSAEQYRALAASIPDGFVLLFDAELRYLIADGAELPFFGYPQSELEGHTVEEVFGPALAAEVVPRYRAALNGERVQWEERLQERIFVLKAAPVSSADGEVFAGMVIAQNVTIPRRAQAVRAALQEIATSVARNDASERIFTEMALSLTKIFNSDTAAIVQFVGAATGEVLAVAPNESRSGSSTIDLSPGSSTATAEVARTAKAALVRFEQSAGEAADALRSSGLVAGAAAPIHHGGVLWGAIALAATDSDRFNAEVLDQLVDFTELAQIALGNLDAWAALSKQAASDQLTGLPNRRAFEAHLEREVEAVGRDGDALTMILMDVDHFKLINDEFGHAAGDGVLAALASVLSSSARQSEIVARVGGEEFAWILPRTSIGAAMRAAERAREAIEAHDFGAVGAITISLGISALCGSEDPAALMAAADSALYEAKRAGRNRSVVYREGSR